MTSASGIDWVAGTRFILPIEITKKKKEKKQKTDKIYETTILETLEIKTRRVVIPEKWRANEASPIITLAYSLERVYSLQFKLGEPKWSLEDSLSWGGRTKCPGGQGS